jgi:hypothetical protein
MNCLYQFLDLNEDHDIKNFKQKVLSGMVNFIDYLTTLRIDQISNGNFLKAKRAIRNLNEGRIRKENIVAYAVYLWFCEILDLQSNSYPTEYVDESLEFHQSEDEERKYGSNMPIVREESASTSNKLMEYLEPTLVREKSEEEPPKQLLTRIESNISTGGPQSWDMLGKGILIFS